MPKTMVYKEEDGTKYKISYSEELQLKSLEETKKLAKWEKMNFYAKIVLIIMIAVAVGAVLFLFYRLDQVNFFSGILYR